jgi:hypothetical protein
MKPSTGQLEQEMNIDAPEVNEKEQTDAMNLLKEDRERFKDVLENIKLDRVAQFASTIRRQGHVSMAFDVSLFNVDQRIPWQQ